MKIKKIKISNIKETQLKKEEFYEDNYDNEYDYCDDIINNNNIINVKIKRKRGTKKHCSMKKKEIVEVKVKKFDNKVEKEKEYYEDDYMTSSCSSLADGDKNMQKLSINDNKNNKKNDNNKNKRIIVIKSEENSEIEKYQKWKEKIHPFFLYIKILLMEILKIKKSKKIIFHMITIMILLSIKIILLTLAINNIVIVALRIVLITHFQLNMKIKSK